MPHLQAGAGSECMHARVLRRTCGPRCRLRVHGGRYALLLQRASAGCVCMWGDVPRQWCMLCRQVLGGVGRRVRRLCATVLWDWQVRAVRCTRAGAALGACAYAEARTPLCS